MTIGVPVVTGLPRLYQQCTIRQKQSKTVKTAKMTIGVPIVTHLPRLYQQCTNRLKQSKDSQTAKNDHWCTNRYMSTHSPPNTQSRRSRCCEQRLNNKLKKKQKII